MYVGSRVLYSMAGTTAPRFFSRTNKLGVPIYGVLVTAAFGALAFLNVSNDGTTVFTWLMNIVTLAGLICWCFISAAHIRFMDILKSRHISRDSLPFRANFGPKCAWVTLFFLVLITFIQGYSAFFDCTPSKFFTAYISLILFVFLWVIPQFTIYRNEPFLIPLDEVDIDTDARQIDDEVWEEVELKGMEKVWDFLL